MPRDFFDPSDVLCILAVDAGEQQDVEAMQRQWPEGCDTLFVDSYDLDGGFEHRCRTWARRIVVIDDLAQVRHDADILVNHNAGRSSSAYAGLLPAGAHVFAGSSFALLAAPFARAREARVPRETSQGPMRLLISVGGADPAGLTGMVVSGVAHSRVPSEVVAVVPTDTDAEMLTRQAGSKVIRFEVAVKPGRIAQLMSEADVAIGAGGVSMLERCCLGLPSLTVCAAENQWPGAEAVAASGGCRLLGDADSVSPQDVDRALQALWEQPDQWLAMSRAASRLCDGRGAFRVAAALQDGAATSDNRSVSLRMTTSEDRDFLLMLERRPETRRFSRNPATPTPAEHDAWFADRRARGSCVLNIIMYNDMPCGVLRLDRTTGDRAGYEVGVAVQPEYLRRGIALAALRQAAFLADGLPLWANVVPENTASAALFRAAGYQVVTVDWLRADPTLH